MKQKGGKIYAPIRKTIFAFLFFFLAAAFIGCVQQSDETPAPGKVNVSASAYEINDGDEITVEAFSAEPGTKVLTINFGFEKKSVQCNGQCAANGKFTPEAGIYSLSAEAKTPGGTLKSGKKTVVVNRALLSCIDGTAFGSCSGNLPWACESGILREDCEKCSCTKGSACTEKKCVQLDGNATGKPAETDANAAGKKPTSGKPGAQTGIVPEKPVILGVFSEGDDVAVSWTAVEGAAEYRIYKSVDANPAFIQYLLVKKVDGSETSALLQALPKGTHFFVMAAANALGNEGPYSEVKVMQVGQ